MLFQATTTMTTTITSTMICIHENAKDIFEIIADVFSALENEMNRMQLRFSRFSFLNFCRKISYSFFQYKIAFLRYKSIKYHDKISFLLKL